MCISAVNTYSKILRIVFILSKKDENEYFSGSHAVFSLACPYHSLSTYSRGWGGEGSV